MAKAAAARPSYTIHEARKKNRSGCAVIEKGARARELECGSSLAAGAEKGHVL